MVLHQYWLAACSHVVVAVMNCYELHVVSNGYELL